LTGCVLMGPRIGRFDRAGRLVTMPGHSVPLSALGGFILMFGFFACNGAKQVSVVQALSMPSRESTCPPATTYDWAIGIYPLLIVAPGHVISRPKGEEARSKGAKAFHE